jgi:hypothetical protein
METLSPLFAGYFGSEYNLMHQHCACHIIDLIVKSILKRFKPYTEDFRTSINLLNSCNHRIAMFKNYCSAQGLRLRNFGLDMDVRRNATYLLLKHLLPYKDVFIVFINSNLQHY